MVKYFSFNRNLFTILIGFGFTFNLLFGQNPSVATFSRLGFGSRGIALGNAMSSVTKGEIIGYYNPAILPFSNQKSASLTIGILSLDRNLDFLHYTQSVYPTAGFSIFIVRAGVKNVDLRDKDGYHIKNINTNEYLIGFSFANRIIEKLSLGLSLKFYYNQLYQEIVAQTLGIDFGLLYKLNDHINAGVSVHDINAKYKWDSSILYQEKGRTITDNFPLTVRSGVSYFYKDLFIVSTGYKISGSEGSLNFGTELYPLYFTSEQFRESICIRVGVEYLKNPDFAFGFGLSRKISNFIVLFDYTYKFERYSPSGMQFLTLGLKLK
ncbi:MAG: hypothetical protein RMJ81_06990 [Candidatus Kryptonium sp.]|nr:hypothetical protein [Candidatus Kryptonium sp.]